MLGTTPLTADESAAQEHTWPVKTFDELADALGRSETLTVRGRSVPVAEARDLVPTYYFPVTSARDLEAKLADLEITLGDQDFDVWAERFGGSREDVGGWS